MRRQHLTLRYKRTNRTYFFPQLQKGSKLWGLTVKEVYLHICEAAHIMIVCVHFIGLAFVIMQSKGAL